MFHVYRFLEKEEAQGILSQLELLEWKQGRARTEALTGTIKQNLELLSTDSPVVSALSRSLTKRLIDNRTMLENHMLSKAHSIKFNKYTSGGTYNRHTDSPMMKDVRTDFACTLFLSDPKDYDGGELQIETPLGLRGFKGEQGEAVVYECGAPHGVTPVTRGARVCGVTWMQSSVQDAAKRSVLQDTHRLAQEIETQMLQSNLDPTLRKWHVDIGKIQGNLYRMWAN